MVLLSRPLQIIVKKGGDAVWKEVSFRKLPKDLQNSTLNKMPIYFLVLPFTAATIGYYAMAQYQFNPKSWVAIQIGKIVEILFPPQKTTMNPVTTWKNKAQARYKEIIDTERAMRRGVEEVQVEEKTEEELREQLRREELNETLGRRFEEIAKSVRS